MIVAVSTRRAENPRMSSPRARRFMPALGTWLIVMLVFAPALAQAHQVQLSGRVQWIAADKLMLILDGGLGVVPVHLTRVPLDQYQTLSQRDQIAVVGVVSDDGRGVIGASVIRIPNEGEQP
jgi:hypothetical protein